MTDEKKTQEKAEAKKFKAKACCKGCNNAQPCRNQLHRPKNIEACAVLHGLIAGPQC